MESGRMGRRGMFGGRRRSNGRRRNRRRKNGRRRNGRRRKKRRRRRRNGRGGCTSQAKKLIKLVNNYRKSKGQRPVPRNDCLCETADAHTDEHNQGIASRHDWSDCSGSCSHKAREICGYNGKAYENYAMGWGKQTPDQAFGQWKRSSGHNAMMINTMHWKGWQFKGMGASVNGNYAVLLMGD